MTNSELQIADVLTVEDIWNDSDASGLRAEIRAQWPQLATALDAMCNFQCLSFEQEQVDRIIKSWHTE